jgi:hypothetical protein
VERCPLSGKIVPTGGPRTLPSVIYRAGKRTIEQPLTDYEDRLLDADHGGSTTDYLHAAILVKAVQRQALWGMIADVAARVGAIAAMVTLVVR